MRDILWIHHNKEGYWLLVLIVLFDYIIINKPIYETLAKLLNKSYNRKFQ